MGGGRVVALFGVGALDETVQRLRERLDQAAEWARENPAIPVLTR